jgi:hypothetical protein
VYKAEGSRDYGLLTDLAFFYDVMKGLFLCGCVWYYLVSSLLSPFSFFAPLQAIYQFHLLLLAEFVTGVGKWRCEWF